jgi:hypothetical protein
MPSKNKIILTCAVLIVGFSAIILMVGFFGIFGYLTGNSFGGQGVRGSNQVDCSGVATLTNEQYQWVKDASGKYLGGDEAALIALIQIESGWNPNAQNPSSSAAGLGQFVTDTARGFPEFTGGDDKHGTVWPAGNVYDDPSSHPDDARFDAKRSIYATAHLLGGMIQKYGSLGEAYEKGYHGGNTPEQIAEAKKGRQRLEEMYQKLLNNGGCQQIGGLASGYGCNNVPKFKQCDNQWAGSSYNCGDATICSSGCGVTATAMVLRFYGKDVDPELMAQKSLQYGTRVCGSGTGHDFFPKIAQEYGLKNENDISWDRAMTLLKQGRPIIVSGQGQKPFTSGGHFVVMTCYNNDGTIAVNDPFGGSDRDINYSEYTIHSQQHFLTAIYL